MKKNKLTIIESDPIFFKSKIQIFKESDLYYFECNNIKLSNFITNDYMEAVAALMKLKDTFDFDNLWEIPISNKMRDNININRSLYWITGGDREWVCNKTYNKTWAEYYEIFVDKYSKRLEKIIDKCETLGEVREEILKYMSLPMVYEFALSKNMV